MPSCDNGFTIRQVNASVLLEAVLAGSDDFRIVTVGRAELPRCWANRGTFVRRGLEDHLVYGIESGRLNMFFEDGSTSDLPQGSIMWAQPGCPITFEVADASTPMYVFFIRFHVGSSDALKLSGTTILAPVSPDGIDLFPRLLPGAEGPSSLQPLEQRARLVDLLCHVLRSSQKVSRGTGGLSPTQQRSCLNYVHQNLDTFFLLRDLANHCGLNPAYLSRQFRLTFGMPFQSYVKRERIRKAQGMLLETGMRVSDVAQQLGYDSSYYFSRQFKEVTGASPRHWRARNT